MQSSDQQSTTTSVGGAAAAPSVESGPGETDHLKTQERQIDERPTSRAEMDDKVKQENGITDADVKAEIAKQQEEEQQQPAAATSQVGAEQEETKPLSDGDKEEKVVQDAVKQSEGMFVDKVKFDSSCSTTDSAHGVLYSLVLPFR